MHKPFALTPAPQGSTPYPPCLAPAASEPPPGDGGDPSEVLTEEDWQLIVLAAHGLTRRQIASRLGILPTTVSSAWARIYSRLGIRTRQELLAWYRASIAAIVRAGRNNPPDW